MPRGIGGALALARAKFTLSHLEHAHPHRQLPYTAIGQWARRFYAEISAVESSLGGSGSRLAHLARLRSASVDGDRRRDCRWDAGSDAGDGSQHPAGVRADHGLGQELAAHLGASGSAASTLIQPSRAACATRSVEIDLAVEEGTVPAAAASFVDQRRTQLTRTATKSEQHTARPVRRRRVLFNPFMPRP